MENKVVKAITVDPLLWNKFQFITSSLGLSMSNTLESFIKDFCIKNTALVNEINELKNNYKNNEL